MSLADRIVALGVGKHFPTKRGSIYVRSKPAWGIEQQIAEHWHGLAILTADKFTHSWAVAGALMGELTNGELLELLGAAPATTYDDFVDPHTIILACVEALEE